MRGAVARGGASATGMTIPALPSPTESPGVDASRITAISHGEACPLCTERTEACGAWNRRAGCLVKP